jgi:hypothetical protein
MTMGGEHEMDTGSLAGTDVFSRSGQQYPDMSSIVDGALLDAQYLESLAEDDVVHVDARGDETSAPSRCGGALCPLCASEACPYAHLANSTYGMLLRMVKAIRIPLSQGLPQVCMNGSYAFHKWALALQCLLTLISDMYRVSPLLCVGGPCRRRVAREVYPARFMYHLLISTNNGTHTSRGRGGGSRRGYGGDSGRASGNARGRGTGKGRSVRGTRGGGQPGGRSYEGR